MNEDKIRAEFETIYSKIVHYYGVRTDIYVSDLWNGEGYISDEIDNAYKVYQAALATRPDVNQELVEALDELVGLKRYKEANGKDEYYRKYQPLTWEKARQALVKHKAGDVCITEEYLVNKIMEELPSFSIAIHNPDDVTNYKYAMNISKNIIHALKAAGALRLRGE